MVAYSHGHRALTLWVALDFCLFLRGGAIHLYAVLDRYETNHNFLWLYIGGVGGW